MFTFWGHSVFTGPRKACGSKHCASRAQRRNRPSRWWPGAHTMRNTGAEHLHGLPLGSAGFSIAPFSSLLHNTAGILLLLLALQSFRAQPSPSSISFPQSKFFILYAHFHLDADESQDSISSANLQPYIKVC